MRLHQASFYRFHEHDFTKTILKDYQPLMKLEHDKVDFSQYTHLQKYQAFTSQSYGQVLSQCDRIDQSKVLLNSYPFISAWRQKYSRSQYLQYHTEMYLTAIAGLIDRLMLLANSVYYFDTPEDQVRIASVLKELNKLSETRVHGLIVEIKHGSSETKKLRDRAMHSVRYHHKDLRHLAVIEHLIKEGGLPNKHQYLKSDIAFYVYFFKRSISDEIQKTEDNLIPLVDQLLTALECQYRAKCDEVAEVMVSTLDS
jgi:hypothetical protein